MTNRPPALVVALASVLPGVAVAVVLTVLGHGRIAPLIGWDVTAAAYLGLVFDFIRDSDGEQTRALAAQEDPRRLVTELFLVGAAVASLVAVGLVVVRAGDTKGAPAVALAGLALLSVAVSWALVHTVFMLRYAFLHYDDQPGGVDWNDDESPTYSDFAYLSFTIGMTFQVSDTSFRSSRLRRVALRHALLSYLFGAFILAGTINLISGLGR